MKAIDRMHSTRFGNEVYVLPMEYVAYWYVTMMKINGYVITSLSVIMLIPVMTSYGIKWMALQAAVLHPQSGISSSFQSAFWKLHLCWHKTVEKMCMLVV